MKNPFRGRRSESQISDYIRLGAVLQKDRSSLKQEAVDAVLRSRASPGEKLEKIKHIDEADERYAPPAPQRKKPAAGAAAETDSDRAFGPADDEDKNDLRLAKRNQHKLIKPQAEIRFFPFLFREYGAIKRFAARSDVLTVSFPFRVRLSKEGLLGIASDMERLNLHAVCAVLEQIIQNGWQVLEKFEYNCLVVLSEYCRCLSAVHFRALDRHDRYLLNRLKDLERLYLVLHTAPHIREAVFSALAKIIDHFPRGAARTTECAGQVHTLLTESENRPTVGNLILGLNMLRWRRFFVMSDLVDYSPGGCVCDTAFDCPDEVRLAIQAYIERQAARLAALVRERARLDREIDFFPFDKTGEIDYGDLIHFYNRQTDPKNAGTWQHDTEQLSFFMVRIIDLFIQSFRPLLCEMLAFEPSGIGSVFDGAIFDSDFDLLSHAQKQLEKHMFSFGTISWSRYHEIRGTNKTATRIEAEAFSIITDILSRLHTLAQKLTSYMTPPGPAGGGDANGNAAAGGSGPAAHRDKVIRGQGVIAGKTVAAALRYALGIAYGIGLYLLDPSLWGIITREAPLKGDFEGIMRTLQRIAPARVFNDLQKKYMIP